MDLNPDYLKYVWDPLIDQLGGRGSPANTFIKWWDHVPVGQRNIRRNEQVTDEILIVASQLLGETSYE